MKRKIIALCLIVAMLGVAVVGSTLAYFTDTAEATNVFTVGKIDIDLIEEVDVLSSTGKSLAADKLVYDETGAVYKDIMPTNKLRKEVTIRNNDAPAYVRVLVVMNKFLEMWEVLEKSVDEKVDNDATIPADQKDAKKVELKNQFYAEIFDCWNITFTGTAACGSVIDASKIDKVLAADTTIAFADYHLFDDANFIKSPAEEQSADELLEQHEGGPAAGHYAKILNPYERCYAYYMYLDKGESVTLFKGLNCPDYFTEEQAKIFENLKIDVYADAIQAESFEADAKAAFDALNVAHPIAALADGRQLNGAIVARGTLVSNADELVKALENGEDVVLEDDVKIDPAGMSNAYGTTGINVKNGQTIDGNGNTLDIKGAGGTWDSGINTTGGTIKNLTVTGSFRGIFVNHNSTHSEPVVLENVTIEGVTYTISCDQGLNQTLTATNSTFKGWTSFAATLGNAKFVDCNFGYGNGYSYCRPYAPTEFVGCEFEAGYTIDPRAAVTFENCTIDGQPLTDANVAELVTKTANVTVK